MNRGVLDGINATAYESMALDSSALQRHYFPTGRKCRLRSAKIRQVFPGRLVSEGVEKDFETNF